MAKTLKLSASGIALCATILLTSVTPGLADHRSGRPVTIRGVLTDEGVECQTLRDRRGRLYTLSDVPDRFSEGDFVQVRGRVAEFSICQQGTTISVERIRRIR